MYTRLRMRMILYSGMKYEFMFFYTQSHVPYNRTNGKLLVLPNSLTHSFFFYSRVEQLCWKEPFTLFSDWNNLGISLFFLLAFFHFPGTRLFYHSLSSASQQVYIWGFCHLLFFHHHRRCCRTHIIIIDRMFIQAVVCARRNQLNWWLQRILSSLQKLCDKHNLDYFYVEKHWPYFWLLLIISFFYSRCHYFT